MSHLYFEYSMVGVTNRYDEFVCVICEQMGWERINISKRGTHYKDTPTNQHGSQPPEDLYATSSPLAPPAPHTIACPCMRADATPLLCQPEGACR